MTLKGGAEVRDLMCAFLDAHIKSVSVHMYEEFIFFQYSDIPSFFLPKRSFCLLQDRFVLELSNVIYNKHYIK